jgi:predicted Rossmann fold nucleotide-binding protein DprA/Smf involved in DNA uptake
MKDVQKELVTITATLSSLVDQIEKIAEAIETEGGKAEPAKKTKAVKKAKAPATKTRVAAKKAAKGKPRTPTKAADIPDSSATADGQTMLDNIYGMISRSRAGITVERLKKRTGLEARQVSNALYKLTKKGKVETLSRGIYIKKKN